MEGQIRPQMWRSEFEIVVPPGGLEPPTVGLKVRCSAIELEGRGDKSTKMERQDYPFRQPRWRSLTPMSSLLCSRRHFSVIVKWWYNEANRFTSL